MDTNPDGPSRTSGTTTPRATSTSSRAPSSSTACGATTRPGPCSSRASGAPYNPTTVTGSVGRGLTYGYGTYSSTGGPSGLGGRDGPQLLPVGQRRGRRHLHLRLHGRQLRPHGPELHRRRPASAGSYGGGGPGEPDRSGRSQLGEPGQRLQGDPEEQVQQVEEVRRASASEEWHRTFPTPPATGTSIPHYVDAWGDPCARITHDWTPNGYLGAAYFASSPGNAPFIAILQQARCDLHQQRRNCRSALLCPHRLVGAPLERR